MSGTTLVGHSMERTTSSPPSPDEVACYYAGLPSAPALVARTGSTPWKAPTGPEAYTRPKELRVVGKHEINSIWEDILAPKLHTQLHEHNVNWSSIDVVRIAYTDESSGNPILWIGVRPGTLPYKLGIDVAFRCKGLLVDHDIKDVEVEIRESEVMRSAGPQLLGPTVDIDPTLRAREPFTATLGIPISPASMPSVEGTGGFFLKDASNTLFLVTARHVVFPDPKDSNELFEHTSASQRRDILVLCQESFDKHLGSIRKQIEREEQRMRYNRDRIEATAGRDDELARRDSQDARRLLENGEASVEALQNILHEFSTLWATEQSRVIGHVVFSPPIIVGAGTEQYTQDIAVIQIDNSKINSSSFLGNTIDLGTKFSSDELEGKMRGTKNTHPFIFPGNRLLTLRDTIEDVEMCNPTSVDEWGDPCIMVLKHGRTTGLTVGRANPIKSYTRNYFSSNNFAIAKEWPILDSDHKSAFSDNGDSGSVVVDGAGRIGGLLTGGIGNSFANDVTYVTPISFIMKVINDNQALATACLFPPGPAPA